MSKLSETQLRNLQAAAVAAGGERDDELEQLGIDSLATKVRTREAQALADRGLVEERRPIGGYDRKLDAGHAYVRITPEGIDALAEARAEREAAGLPQVSPLRPSRRYGQGHRFGNAR